MKSSAKKIELASVDDLFSTEEGRQDAKLEKIQEIPLSELHARSQNVSSTGACALSIFGHLIGLIMQIKI